MRLVEGSAPQRADARFRCRNDFSGFQSIAVLLQRRNGLVFHNGFAPGKHPQDSPVEIKQWSAGVAPDTCCRRFQPRPAWSAGDNASDSQKRRSAGTERSWVSDRQANLAATRLSSVVECRRPPVVTFGKRGESDIGANEHRSGIIEPETPQCFSGHTLAIGKFDRNERSRRQTVVGASEDKPLSVDDHATGDCRNCLSLIIVVPDSKPR